MLLPVACCALRDATSLLHGVRPRFFNDISSDLPFGKVSRGVGLEGPHGRSELSDRGFVAAVARERRMLHARHGGSPTGRGLPRRHSIGRRGTSCSEVKIFEPEMLSK